MRVSLDQALAADVLRRMPPEPRKRIKAKLRLLEGDPLPSNRELGARQMESNPERSPVYRIKVGHWRIIYTVESSRVYVIRIMPRDEGYDWLD